MIAAPATVGRLIGGGTNDMGKHEDKDKGEQQRKIDSNGHDPNRPIPDKDSGGKHGKDDDEKDDDKK